MFSVDTRILRYKEKRILLNTSKYRLTVFDFCVTIVTQHM